MAGSDILEALTDARAHAHSLGIRPSPMFDLRAQVARAGIELAQEAEEEGRRRSDFHVLHEAMEATYRPTREDLTDWGREVLIAEGASEILAPADAIRRAIRTHGWDLFAIREEVPLASYELLARRLLVIAHEDEVTLLVTIVDDGRVYLRRSSEDPWSRCRRILAEECRAWLEHTRQESRQVTALRATVAHEWLRLRGSRPPMPQIELAVPLREDVAESQPDVSVTVYPIPLAAGRPGPRREIILTTVEV